MTKLIAGSPFPKIELNDSNGVLTDLRQCRNGADWKMIVVYRGVHCPLCTKYLNMLEERTQKLVDMGIDIVAVSSDSLAQLKIHQEKLNVTFPILYGLSIEQMKSLGLYISHPRSEHETDHPFSEPGMYILNEQANIQVIDISNAPFSRPDLNELVGSLGWLRTDGKDYPIRGTY